MKKSEEMANTEHLIKIPIPEASVSLFIVNYDFIDIAHFPLILPAKPVKYILGKSEIKFPSYYFQIKKIHSPPPTNLWLNFQRYPKCFYVRKHITDLTK